MIASLECCQKKMPALSKVLNCQRRYIFVIKELEISDFSQLCLQDLVENSEKIVTSKWIA